MQPTIEKRNVGTRVELSSSQNDFQRKMTINYEARWVLTPPDCVAECAGCAAEVRFLVLLQFWYPLGLAGLGLTRKFFSLNSLDWTRFPTMVITERIFRGK